MFPFRLGMEPCLTKTWETSGKDVTELFLLLERFLECYLGMLCPGLYRADGVDDPQEMERN